MGTYNPSTAAEKWNHSIVRVTLIELLVAIAIIAILASLLLPALGRAHGVAYGVECRNNLRTLGLALRMYTDESGHYPATMRTPRCPLLLRKDDGARANSQHAYNASGAARFPDPVNLGLGGYKEGNVVLPTAGSRVPGDVGAALSRTGNELKA